MHMNEEVVFWIFKCLKKLETIFKEWEFEIMEKYKKSLDESKQQGVCFGCIKCK